MIKLKPVEPLRLIQSELNSEHMAKLPVPLLLKLLLQGALRI